VHELECPAILDLQKPLIKQYVRKFPSSLYEVRAGDRKLTLRFAACQTIYASEHIRLKATRTDQGRGPGRQ
jgi:threonyl-tRNA synthetase